MWIKILMDDNFGRQCHWVASGNWITQLNSSQSRSDKILISWCDSYKFIGNSTIVWWNFVWSVWSLRSETQSDREETEKRRKKYLYKFNISKNDFNRVLMLLDNNSTNKQENWIIIYNYSDEIESDSCREPTFCAG